MLLLSTLALADIPPTPPPNQQFVTHTVQPEGLADHPEHVLLLFAKGDTISSYRTFSADNPSFGVEGELLRAGFSLMKRSDYVMWADQTRDEILRQRTACAERGEGCAHISRFEPSFAPPTAVVDCGMTLALSGTAAMGEPTSHTHSYRLTAAGETCTMVAAEAAPAPEPDPATPAPAPAPEPAAPSGEEAGCATVGAAPLSAVVVVAMLLGLRRRCRF